MISVSHALEQLFSLVEPIGTETVPLQEANGRHLAEDAVARRDQPPFAASAMDGYAVVGKGLTQGDRLRVIGEAAAGHPFDGHVKTGETARIFTGAPLPEGADHIIIQEDVSRDTDHITLTEPISDARHIRPAANDFRSGDRLTAPRRLRPADIALMAAMNIADVTVAKRPRIAIIATGDELVQPGETPSPSQIIASNSYGLHAMLNDAGAQAHLLPIARDNVASLKGVFDLAMGADLIVTIGGASVGDHDLVADVAQSLGMNRAFYKVAMRPGKPLMAGSLGGSAMVGLPGNPVSAMVCGQIFILPMMRKMLGLGEAPTPSLTAPLAHPLSVNSSREHYMRARLTDKGLEVFERQDSSLLGVLAQANALVIHTPNAPAAAAGDLMRYIAI